MKREDFLDRISARLRRPRPGTVVQPTSGVPPFHAPLRADEQLLQRFRFECERVGGEVLVADPAQVSNMLSECLARWQVRRYTAWPDAESWGTFGSNGTERVENPRDAELGITTASAAIAETGSLFLQIGSGRPRQTSLVPPRHLAIVRDSALVPRIGDAFALLRSANTLLPSQALFITGPSRTSDIENDLTIGVHGPAAVTVLFVRT